MSKGGDTSEPGTADEEPAVVPVSVRGLVEFLLRSGDLGVGGKFVASNRAVQGTRGHQRLQKTRPEGYVAEVPVEYRAAGNNLELKVTGRIDGILPNATPPWVEEIKTTEGAWMGDPHPLHLAQLDCYAAIYAIQQEVPEIETLLSYYDLETGMPTEFRRRKSRAELEEFLSGLIRDYLVWAEWQREWRQVRDRSIRETPFPFAEFREGQRRAAVSVYRGVRDGRRLFVEAPTGTGKTISMLFPSVKVLADKRLDRIFFLTAKNAGAAAARDALEHLRTSGARLRSVSLTARDKVCICRQPASEFTPETCPYAAGYFDRVKPAVRELAERETIDAAATLDVAAKHCVCPFELSLDASLWCDVIIGDYNYAFDPSASLKRFFGEGAQDAILLVDEAHNLVERGREMFSANFETGPMRELCGRLGKSARACKAALQALLNASDELLAELSGPTAEEEPPKLLLQKMRRFLAAAEEWLVGDASGKFRDDLMEAYFNLYRFVRSAEDWRESMRFIADPVNSLLRLFCTNPAEFLRATMDTVHASVFFSATLKPPDYYQKLLSGVPEDGFVELDTPFPPENLCVTVATYLPMNLKARSGSSERLFRLLSATVRARPGNYLIYFPSFLYLNELSEQLREELADFQVLVQEPGMDRHARDAFVESFQSGVPTVGLAMLGGIFGEAIDLAGERLIGVVVIGVGLPQLSFERDLIKQSYEEREGFEMAYVYPGMNRVLQAAGRVIRTPQDRGVVLLVDSRFREPRYRNLFPAWWRPVLCRTEEQVLRELRTFWAGAGV